MIKEGLTIAETVLKESPESIIKESPILEQLDTIKNNSLESLKAQNEMKLGLECEGKEKFYPKACSDLLKIGKLYEDNELKGTIGVVPLDAVINRDNEVIPTEIKSPSELKNGGLPSGESLKNDYIRLERDRVEEQVKNGNISTNVGKHEIHMAQAEHRTREFIDKKWSVRNQPELNSNKIKVGYCIPKGEATNAEEALKNKGIVIYEKIEGDSSVTYIYDLP